jgi:hypothetical protein
MKILQNPWVTGSLALAAVAVVYFQVVQPQLGRGRSISTPRIDLKPLVNAIAPGLAPSPSPRPEPAPTNAPILLEASIDQRSAESHFKGWVNSPLRDPFLLFGPPKAEQPIAETNSPLTHMKLKGIWEQTGGRLAVINRRVYVEGDEIEGYKIIHIDRDEVWFQGPIRKERLGLDMRQSIVPAPANAREQPVIPTNK